MLGAAVVAIVVAAVAMSVLFLFQSAVPLAYANQIAPNVIATATVPSSCAISLNVFSANFGDLNPGVNSITTSQNVLDTNGGNVGTYIWVYGGNWISGGNSFGVKNTTYSSSSATNYASGTQLTTASANTNIAVASATSSNIWFGTGVPVGQAAGTYSQNVVITNVC